MIPVLTVWILKDTVFTVVFRGSCISQEILKRDYWHFYHPLFKMCNIIFSSLPAEMYQSRLSLLISNWVHERYCCWSLADWLEQNDTENFFWYVRLAKVMFSVSREYPREGYIPFHVNITNCIITEKLDWNLKILNYNTLLFRTWHFVLLPSTFRMTLILENASLTNPQCITSNKCKHCLCC